MTNIRVKTPTKDDVLVPPVYPRRKKKKTMPFFLIARSTTGYFASTSTLQILLYILICSQKAAFSGLSFPLIFCLYFLSAATTCFSCEISYAHAILDFNQILVATMIYNIYINIYVCVWCVSSSSHVVSSLLAGLLAACRSFFISFFHVLLSRLLPCSLSLSFYQYIQNSSYVSGIIRHPCCLVVWSDFLEEFPS